jgi:hypothetical protein
MVKAGGLIYMGQISMARVVQLNDDGSINHNVFTGTPLVLGLATNPTDGHIFVATGAGILDLNPLSGTTAVLTPVTGDGLTTDGKTVYVASGSVQGFRVSDGTKVFDSGPVPGVDGTALGVGTLTGKIYANTNFGTVVEIDLTTAAQSVIASGGSRGDFVTVDPRDGSLLLTQSDRIMRLSPPTGGGFGNPIPEPATLTLTVVATLGLTAYGWRRRRRTR